MKSAKTDGKAAVNEYLASLPPSTRSGLQKLRKAVLAAAPKAEEGFSYGIPAVRIDGRPVVWFAAFKDHLSFFPGAAAVRLHASKLKKYKLSKGTIQFSPDDPLPARLVAALVKVRLAEIGKGKPASASRRAASR